MRIRRRAGRRLPQPDPEQPQPQLPRCELGSNATPRSPRCSPAGCDRGGAAAALSPAWACWVRGAAWPPAARRARAGAAAFLLGTAFGFGFFLLGLYWVGIAFFADAERFGIYAVPAVLGLALFLALTRRPCRGPGGAAPLARRSRPGPWPSPSPGPWPSRSAAGSACSSPGTRSPSSGPQRCDAAGRGLDRHLWPQPADRGRGRAHGTAVPGRHAAAAWPFAAPSCCRPGLVFGCRRAGGSPAAPALPTPASGCASSRPTSPSTTNGTRKAAAGSAAISICRRPPRRTPPAQVVIWPESAVPYDIEAQPEVRDYLAKVVPPPGGALLVGGDRYAVRRASPQIAHNSLFVLGDGAEVLARYDKVNLVPFGEFLPVSRRARPAGPAQADARARSTSRPGPAGSPCALPGLPPASPLICYEAAFPATPPTGRPAGVAGQHHQRRLVRPQLRPLPAPRHGPHARGRGGAAAGPRRQYRHLGGDRPLWPDRARLGLDRPACVDAVLPAAAAAGLARAPASLRGCLWPCSGASVRLAAG